MSDSSIQLRFERILGEVQQPARLVGQEIGSGPGFVDQSCDTRLVLAFPDTYEIGISNQAIQVLYHVARETPGVAVERAYLPWVDVIERMREEDVPLLSLETWSPVSSAHVLAFTLQHEFNYTNVLEMLDLGGIPLLSAERDETVPLVIAGGPATANFFPMALFLDAVAVGEGEEMLADILRCVRAGRREGAGRTELKRRLNTVSGVYVPGVSGSVRKRFLSRLEGAPYPAAPLVPLTAGVHDRAWVEVMRGCTRGCRFCQAGIWYRPVRERAPESIIALAGAIMRDTGHQELGLGSLSTTDYSRLEGLLGEVAERFPEVRVSLPSLRVDSTAVRLAHLVSPTGPSLTLAPEAGSQRMRDVINKNVSDADILGAAEEAFRTGRTSLKLYFMIGLPGEQDEDVEAISDIVHRLRELGRRCLGSRSSRLQLSVSINNFVPKPFTPFQWCGMAAREVLARRQASLRARLRAPGIRVALHDIDKSYLEAALARGGEEMSQVILGAWQRGARFDSWTEQFDRRAWDGALTAAGLTAENLACKEYDHGETLPWDRIRGVVGGEFLWTEWLRAQRGETTGDCRWETCQWCGACPVRPGNDLARDFDVAGGQARCQACGELADAPAGEVLGLSAAFGTTTAPAGPLGMGPAAAEASDGKTPPAEAPDGTPGSATPPAANLRYLLTFSVDGRARYVGHLDKLEVFRRAVRRAGGRLALTAGMRPKPLLSVALPLAVGVGGHEELCEFELAEEPPSDFGVRLAGSLPAGLQVVSLAPYREARRAAARVAGAVYELELTIANPLPRDDPGARLERAAQLFAEATNFLIAEVRADRVRTTDVKTYVDRVELRKGPEGTYVLAFAARVTPTGTVRPLGVVDAIGSLAGLELSVTEILRTRIVLS